MNRLARAWRAMPGDHRLAAVAATGLFVTIFLPWYQLTVRTTRGLDTRRLTAIGDFSWVEAAVLLVALAVLVLLVARAERRPFHLPGGDGAVILVAGAWAFVLLVWRAFDKPGGDRVSATGLSWGFVFAFAAAGALAYAGARIRAAARPEPPLPAAEPEPPTAPTAPAVAVAPGAAPRGHASAGARRYEPDGDPLPPRPRPRQPRPPAPPAPPAPGDEPLTRPHGSEEPLPREDFTEELRPPER